MQTFVQIIVIFLIQRICRGLEDKRDLHLCYACSLWIHSHISPHPQYQFLYEAACTVPKRSDVDNILLLYFLLYKSWSFVALESLLVVLSGAFQTVAMEATFLLNSVLSPPPSLASPSPNPHRLS